MSKKRVYILGPMRGYKLYNFPAFDIVARDLRLQGYEVISPAELDRKTGFDPGQLPKNHNWRELPEGLRLDDVIARDLEAVQSCTAYWALPGWEKSVGATAEKAVLDWMKAEWLNPAFPATGDGLEKAILHAQQHPKFPTAPVGLDVHLERVSKQLATAKDPSLTGPGGAPTRETSLPEVAAERKKFPVASGFLDYFPDAIIAVSRVSWEGNNQHNPGKALFWDRSKSSDESDAMMRHFLRRGTPDTDGQRHSAKLAWRALALLQKEIEAEANQRALDAAGRLG